MKMIKVVSIFDLREISNALNCQFEVNALNVLSWYKDIRPEERRNETLRDFVSFALACNLVKSNTPPWVLFTLFELYKLYQIKQSITSDSV